MKRNTWLSLAAIFSVSACTQLSPEQQIIQDAAAALGGASRINAVTTISLDGQGVTRNFGQDMTFEATGQTFTISDYHQVTDLATGRERIEQTRTPNFNYFRGPDAIMEVFGIDGDVAYNVSPDGQARRAPNATAADRRARFYHHPIALVRAALDPAATVANATTGGSESQVDITLADGLSLQLTIDASSGLPSRVTSKSNNTNIRDVSQQTRFSDYEEVDGLQLPKSVSYSLDDHEIFDLQVTSQSLDDDVDGLDAPEQARSAPAMAGPPPANVTAEVVADGVWFLAGQSHHSVLIEFSDHLMLYEAPNELRTLAVIAKAEELVPDKPLTHLVSSHHHFDHSGGVRAAISKGLTIVTHADNASFYEDLAARTSTMIPDALAQNPHELTLETVEDEATYEDDSMKVQLYHIADNPHADTLVMAYLPRQRLLIQVDAYSPGRDFQPFAANLLENIERRNLNVDRILPIHGSIVPYDALVDAVQGMSH